SSPSHSALHLSTASELLLQKAQEPRCYKPRKAGRFVDRFPHPEMRCSRDNHRPHKESRLLERRDQRFRLRMRIHDIIVCAPHHEKRRVVPLDRGIRERRGLIEYVLAFHRTFTEKSFRNLITGTGNLIMLPLGEEVIDAIDANDHFDVRTDAS